ncbi:S24 family peptidase [Paraburkholderia caffeinilytica]|uniref:S24 family peptidase n=1 Tax=Paraburkholderia caffeinilytica TaxID=1761016 RepID=UPI0038BC2EB0
MDIHAYRRSRLQELVDKEAEGVAAEFARKHNQDATRIRQLLSATYREGRGFGEGAARNLEKALGLPNLYFDFGVESALAAEHNSGIPDASISGMKGTVIVKSDEQHVDSLDEGDLPHPTSDEFAYVQQLDIAAACGDGRFEDHVVVKGGLAFKRSSLREFGVPEHAARIIYAAGGSMAPRIQDGRVVLINTADTAPSDGKIYLICMPDGGMILKRLIHDYSPMVGGLVWILRSDNPDKTTFPDKILPPDDRTMIAGRAVWTDSVL